MPQPQQTMATTPIFRPPTPAEIRSIYAGKRLGQLSRLVLPAKRLLQRLSGNWSKADLLRMACYLDTPELFNLYGVQIAHPYGITLSVEGIGCDCSISQNSTLGANVGQYRYDESTVGNRPRVGSLVKVWPNAVISGKVSIGNCVIVSSGATITRDVPSFTVAYGINQHKPLERSHWEVLMHVFFICRLLYVKIPALCVESDQLRVDEAYRELVPRLQAALGTNEFIELALEFWPQVPKVC